MGVALLVLQVTPMEGTGAYSGGETSLGKLRKGVLGGEGCD